MWKIFSKKSLNICSQLHIRDLCKTESGLNKTHLFQYWRGIERSKKQVLRGAMRAQRAFCRTYIVKSSIHTKKNLLWWVHILNGMKCHCRLQWTWTRKFAAWIKTQRLVDMMVSFYQVSSTNTLIDLLWTHVKLYYIELHNWISFNNVRQRELMRTGTYFWR